MKTLAKYLIFRVMIEFMFTLGRLLKKQHLRKISDFLGSFLFLIPFKRKKIALDNLKLAFRDEYSTFEKIGILRKFISAQVLIALEIAYIIKKGEKLNSWAEVSGLGYLDEALKKGKGVIALSGHLGNIPVMLAWLAERGYPIAVLFKEGKYLPEGFLYNLIKSYNIYPIPFISDKDVPREIIKALNKNMVVFILADQSRPGVYARFFGKSVQCQKGAFIIAERKNSPLLPIFITRKMDRYVINIYPEIEIKSENSLLSVQDDEQIDEKHKNILHSSLDREIQTINAVEKYNNLLESLIRENPEQYYWFHRRFKNMKNH